MSSAQIKEKIAILRRLQRRKNLSVSESEIFQAVREEIKLYRKDQREKQCLSNLECHVTEQDRSEFLLDLKKYFEKKFLDIYHYRVPQNHDKLFVITCQKLNIKVSKYFCKCIREGEEIGYHKHYIIWVKNEHQVKKPTAVITLSMARMLKSLDFDKPGKHIVVGNRIKSRSSLVDTILFIMTANARCQFGGASKKCRHFEHGITTVFPNCKAINTFRDQELMPTLPDYVKNERCQKKAMEKRKKAAIEQFNETIVADVLDKISDFE